jgi:hypothetical protein
MKANKKILASGILGAALGAIITYLAMERLINWFDLVFAAARTEVTLEALKAFEHKGTDKGIEAVRDILKTDLELAKAKCAYFNCSNNPEKYASEISSINRASEYLERMPIRNHSKATQ